MVQFKNEEHDERYYAALDKMKSTDCYHRAVAYLFTLDRDCARHIDDMFDFRGDGINTDGLHSGWQTGTSVQTTRLAFNLWNGFIEKGEEKRFTPDEIFTSTYTNYYFRSPVFALLRRVLAPLLANTVQHPVAIKLRYPEHDYNG